MHYRCPKCSKNLKVRSLFFNDISACPSCGQMVVLGDFLAFAMAALSMPVAALTALYVLSHELDQYIVAAGYSLTIGMITGLLVLFLLGRAKPFRKVRIRQASPATEPAPIQAQAEPRTQATTKA
jgi:uncharacterized membrane protein